MTEEQKISYLLDWEKFKKKMIQLFGGLIMERNEDGIYVISIGRVAFWASFIPAIAIWISGEGKLEAGGAIKDISPNHFNILVLLLGYNLGKKAMDLVKVFINRGKETTSSDSSDGPG